MDALGAVSNHNSSHILELKVFLHYAYLDLLEFMQGRQVVLAVGIVGLKVHDAL